MANSPNIRIPLEDHQEAEQLALKITAKEREITSKNEVIKKAVKLGLSELRKKYGNTK